MNRRFRLFLLAVCFVVFILITPAVVFYALGFRPARARVGVLLLESIPSGARVLVDGTYQGTTPYTVSGRGGVVVDVAIEHEGYRPWGKRLPLVTGITSEARAIRLIPEAVSSEEFVPNTTHFTLSPSRALVASTEKDTLAVQDEDHDLILPPLKLLATPRSLLWSPDSTLLLVSYSNSRFDLISLTEGARHTLPLPTLASPDAIAWDPRTPGKLLFLTSQKVLRAYDSSTGQQHIIAENVSVFSLSKQEIYIATASQEIRRLTLLGEAVGGPSVKLTRPVARLITSPEDRTAVWYADGSVELLEEDKFQPLVASASSLGFSPDGQLLYIQTAPNELVVYNISDERLSHVPAHRLHLVTRLSQIIRHPQWFAGGQHLIYQVGDQVVLTEIDTRDHAQSHVIDSTNLSDAAVAVGEDGERLYYLKRNPTGVTSLVRARLVLE
ncbi:MAG: PEGA domain-containing protein [Patescibacteria group bacterium]